MGPSPIQEKDERPEYNECNTPKSESPTADNWIKERDKIPPTKEGETKGRTIKGDKQGCIFVHITSILTFSSLC